ncbi:unnamed protein product [Soboliphyme baturini]|uniref:Uncharacterized protein n=1 Tax=Soboliphyme baturini TaxID=241478 RepID=A0A183IL82_9BILA|nr:unnamed protein product [Soboliphyme baturini]
MEGLSLREDRSLNRSALGMQLVVVEQKAAYETTRLVEFPPRKVNKSDERVESAPIKFVTESPMVFNDRVGILYEEQWQHF